MGEKRLGWCGTVRQFCDKPPTVEELGKWHQSFFREAAKRKQLDAWAEELPILLACCRQLAQDPTRAGWTLILEYLLPEQGGERPDVVFLTDRDVLVVEFKGHARLRREVVRGALDQVNGYARDLFECHAASHGRRVVPILVLTKGQDTLERDGVRITPPSGLGAYLSTYQDQSKLVDRIDPDGWVDSPYAPTPDVIQAARRIVVGGVLPRNRRAESAKLDQTLARLLAKAKEAKEGHLRHLCFITGVPGSGKTLVGLQFTYDEQFVAEGQVGRGSVLLSGNDPLIAVLQRTLRSDLLVRPVRSFTAQYGRRGAHEVPVGVHALVFDEAQRAYDEERMRKRHGGDAQSEPAILLHIASRIPEWAIMVALVGEGQEINGGEEGGIPQWAEALQSCPGQWVVHCPPHLEEHFSQVANVMVEPLFHLTTSLRTHLAIHLQQWVDRLLEGDLKGAAELAGRLRKDKYPLFATHSLQAARLTAASRYEDAPNRRYGLVVSSSAEGLPFDTGREAMRRLDIASWFCDPPTSERSCCRLEQAVTQFQCQGLELDLPLVHWGDDVNWDGQAWQTKEARVWNAKDARRILLNRYRVLLTRGRDGLVVIVPPEATATYQALLSAGMLPLPQGDWAHQ